MWVAELVMMSPFAIHLQKQFASIKSRKPQFSMRSFALMLGISPASLSKVLNGKQNLTEGSIRQIARHLRMDDRLTDDFVKASSFHLNESFKRENSVSVRKSIEIFDIFSNWYHFAILEWLRVHNGKVESDLMSRQLGVSVESIESSIELLKQHEFIKHGVSKNEYEISENSLRFGDTIPSRAIREYHSQLIAKASQALEGQHYSVRNISSSTISISKESYDQIVNEIVRFRKKISKIADSDTKSDRIYALNVQLTPLSLEDESTK